MLDGADLVHEIVAARPVGFPCGGQLLFMQKYLLDNDIGAPAGGRRRALPGQSGEPPTQRTAIARGMAKPVDMVDAHALDCALRVEAEDEGVYCLECLGIFHPQTDELADIEEATPVDLVIGDAPPSEAVVLARQNCIEALVLFYVAVYRETV